MPQLKVTASSLNVREQPSVESRAVGFLQRDDVVEDLGASDDGYWHRIRLGTLEGWCARKFLAPTASAEFASRFAWLPIARGEEGTAEIPGLQHNGRILEYLRSTTLAAPFNDQDETAWCSAFVNWCVERAGYEGTDSAWARSWLNWGRPLTTPEPGCIVVLRRLESNGHVGFYVGETDTHVKVLGGNQGNKVGVSLYAKADLLGYRTVGTS